MAHEFPPLAERPETLDDLYFAINPETGRPRIWDEHGVPVDSYFSPDDELMPLRHPDDYAHVEPTAGYAPNIVSDNDGYKVNEGLMDYMRPRLPDTLHLAIDGGRAYRRGLQIDRHESLTVGNALTLTIGLNSLWALLMYRTHNRVQNGALPAHVADMHRSFIGFEGLLSQALQNVKAKGGIDAIVSPLALDKDAALSMKREIMGELWGCPSALPFIRAVLSALIDPTPVSTLMFSHILNKRPAPQLLKDMQVADKTFAGFAVLMRQASDSDAPKDFLSLQRLLQLPAQ